MVPISKRMKTIADMVPDKMSVADIGCDHGFVAIYLVLERMAPRAVAMDVNEGPLIRAKEHILQYGLDDKIDTRLSDGAEKLGENEVDAAIIAGMGGRLTIRIMENSMEKFRALKSLVLSPHSDIVLVREYLVSQGFVIDDEEMVFDEEKYYTIVRCHYDEGGEELLDIQKEFGPKLIEKKHPVLKDYILNEHRKMKEIVERLLTENDSEAIRTRIGEIKDKIDKMEMLLNMM